jgi:hypothetical protein
VAFTAIGRTRFVGFALSECALMIGFHPASKVIIY